MFIFLKSSLTSSLLSCLTAQWTGARPVRWHTVVARAGLAASLLRTAATSPRLRSSSHEMFALDRSRSHPVRVLLDTLDLRSKEAAVRSS